MKDKEAIAAKVEEFVFREFPLARKRKITSDTSLLESGIVDSMGILEIVTFIESEFNTTVTDDEMLGGHFNSIQSLTDYVTSKVDSEQPA